MMLSRSPRDARLRASQRLPALALRASRRRPAWPSAAWAALALAAQPPAVQAAGEVRAISAGRLPVPGSVAPGGRYQVQARAEAVQAIAGTLNGMRPFTGMVVSQAPDAVYVEVVRNGTRFESVAASVNQKAVAQAVERLGAGDALYDTVATQNAGADARRAFDLLSGETHASAKGMLVNDSHFARSAVLGRLRAALAQAPGQDTGHGLWAQGFGAWSRSDGNANAAMLQSRTAGFFAGADQPVGPALRLGVLAGYSHTDFGSLGRWARGRSDNYHLGAYGGAHWGRWGLRLGAIHSWHELRTDRHVGFAGLYDRARATYRAQATQLTAETGYLARMGRWEFEPHAGASSVLLHTGTYRESGELALDGGERAMRVHYATLGLRGALALEAGGQTVSLRAGAGWRRAFGDTTPQATHHYRGNAFKVSGAPIARNAVLLEASAGVALTRRSAVQLDYQASLASRSRQHAGGLVFRTQF
ncbi:autotransporter domain-containing protein [Orrella sp. JC864]|uniref:autotransporter outer membrane beta-barrel domain-containing protein n=1 Tax=Orrella sp. JC864 TaxID=3120298 RepID=UPI00300AD225